MELIDKDDIINTRSSNSEGRAYHRDERGKWTGNWLCNTQYGPRWYEEFEIDTKPFNDTYHKMDINVCSVLRKR